MHVTSLQYFGLCLEIKMNAWKEYQSNLVQEKGSSSADIYHTLEHITGRREHSKQDNPCCLKTRTLKNNFS